MSFSLTQAVTHTGGALWWRSYSGPRDVVWYREVRHPDTPYERVDEGPLSAPAAEDPFSAPAAEEVDADNWTACPWQMTTDPDALDGSSEKEPVVLWVELLTGDERDIAWERYGWGDDE